MTSFDWKGTIGTIAPALAGMLGSPVAGVAVGALCKALGLESSPENAQKVAEQVAAGSLTGDQLLALRKAESDAQAQLAKMGLDYDLESAGLVVKDRDSARNMAIQTKDKTTNYLVYYALAVWTVLNTLLMVMAWRHIAIAPEMISLISRVLGTMDALLGVAFAFFYGTTKDFGRAQELLHQSTPVDGSAK